MKRAAAALALLLLPFSSCGGDGGGVAVPPGEEAFLFAMRGIPGGDGQFVAVTSDPDVIASVEAQLSLPADERSLHIQGPLATGNGGHNLSWTWHFAPGEWSVVDLSAEVCDGTPRMVENDVDGWIKDVGVFCPWSSYVQRRL